MVDSVSECIWLTDQFIIALLDDNYKLQISEHVCLYDGEMISIADIDKYCCYGADKYQGCILNENLIPQIRERVLDYLRIEQKINIILKWRNFGEISIDIKYIHNIFKDPNIRSLKLYNIYDQHTIINQDLEMDGSKDFQFSNIISVRLCLIFDENMIKGG